MNLKCNNANILFFTISYVVMNMVSLNCLAVDETIPHPIDERGLMSRIAIKTTQIFRPVEIIEIRNGVLQKSEITIAPGTVLVIDNKDQANHRLEFPPGPANDVAVDLTSTVIKPGEAWGAEFTNPGIYPYKCTLHPEKEHGVVSVVEKE